MYSVGVLLLLSCTLYGHLAVMESRLIVGHQNASWEQRQWQAATSYFNGLALLQLLVPYLVSMY